ncbi:hypothetical protein VDG44_20540, partial [Xanthomonas campestris pv. raphani]|uniref:hypothetical protein n=1 Tax=Xanthomonas campestris TaxID=339 RepID=UPI002B3DFEAE|nr:hypothetical protein [Xanthomonas campestris pv. raphani]
PNIWQTPISSTPDFKPGRYSGRGDVGSTPALRYDVRFRTQQRCIAACTSAIKKHAGQGVLFFSSHLLDPTTTKAAPPHR